MQWHVGGMLKSIPFFALAFLVACGRTETQIDAIPAASGYLVQTTTDYAAVVLVIAPEGRGICTGSIVSERAVLTAAHCLLTNGRYVVRTSTGDYSTSTKVTYGPGIVDDPRDIGLLIFNSDIADRANGEVFNIGDQAAVGESVRLVGYGCSNRETRRGAGVKRTGQNAIAGVGEYIELLTPQSTQADSRALIGDAAQTGTCFGDSGGPLLKTNGSEYEIVGVTHAGGTYGDYYFSEFVNVASFSDNRNWLAGMNNLYDLGIQGI